MRLRTFTHRFAHALASWFYLGHLRPSGTIGSLGALPFAYGLLWLGGAVALIFGAVALFCIGWWAARCEVARTGESDPSIVVIDEVVGMWVALIAPSIVAGKLSLTALECAAVVAAAFVFFRVFDILKPSVIGWADRLHTPFGVMLDDVLAGVLTSLVVGAGLIIWSVL